MEELKELSLEIQFDIWFKLTTKNGGVDWERLHYSEDLRFEFYKWRKYY